MGEMATDFDPTIERVLEFYSSFHNEFTDIDNIFEEIDKEGGFNWGKLSRVVQKFALYHATLYSDLADDQETDKNNLDNIKKIVDDLIVTDRKVIVTISEITKKLQTIIYNSMTIDNNWKNKKKCTIIISEILKKMESILEPDDDDKKNIYFTVVSVLKELIADCALSICGLNALCDYNYEEKSFSKLTAEQQLVVVLNMAILTDRMYFCTRSLEIYLSRLEKIIAAFYELDWKVHYVAGLLNFKIHRYQEARNYFQKVEEYFKKATPSDSNTTDKLFHAVLLIAYSYEYSGEFNQAIDKIIGPIQEIEEMLNQYEYNELNDDDFCNILLDLMKKAISKEQGLVGRYFKDSNLENTDSIILGDNTSDDNKRLEILHAFAHCLNEFAIYVSGKENKDESYGKILRFARFVIAYIAKKKAEYWTCFATIHGEYKDYGQALEALDKAEQLITENSPNQVISEKIKAEIAFFKYYFKEIILSDGSSDSDKDVFKKFIDKYSDGDAECHLLVFEFRRRLRIFIDTFMTHINSNNDELDREVIELEREYLILCEQTPTLYMNANIRAELRMMQRAFICIKLLREIIVDGKCTEKKWLLLRNACCRYSRAKQELGLSKVDTETQKFGSSPIDAFFDDNAGILHCLHHSESIFILAPISRSVVYQYQTGEIDTLFDSLSILPKNTNVIDYNRHIKPFDKKYNDSLKKFVIPQIVGIIWEKMPKEVVEVFYWTDSQKEQLLYANRKYSCVRAITAPLLFEKTIKDLFLKASDPENCSEKKSGATYGEPCQFLFFESLPRIEIINETIPLSPSKLYFFKPPSERAMRFYFIKVTEEVANKHALHIILCDNGIDISYDRNHSKTPNNDEESGNLATGQSSDTLDIDFSDIQRVMDKQDSLISELKSQINYVGKDSGVGKITEQQINEANDYFREINDLSKRLWTSQGDFDTALADLEGKINDIERKKTP